ncbi:MAG: hypothetical protein JXR94_14960, partial [Candidatus Hydrogenedentes bacterium]|nr:hypothetical protein [Candidatus Hydrogenedentota bacterium]
REDQPRMDTNRMEDETGRGHGRWTAGVPQDGGCAAGRRVCRWTAGVPLDGGCAAGRRVCRRTAGAGDAD